MTRDPDDITPEQRAVRIKLYERAAEALQTLAWEADRLHDQQAASVLATVARELDDTAKRWAR